MRAARFLPIFLLLTAFPVSAAEFHEDEHLSLTLPIRDDLYAAGEKVDVSNTVDGDVIVGGGNLMIQGDVRGDIAAAGGTVRIEGNVGDDVRVGGGDVIISGTVRDDVFAAGGDLSIEPAAVIGGDVIIAGGDVQMRGTVRGRLRMYGGDLLLAGPVEGPVEIRGDSVTVGASIGGPAEIVAEHITLGSSAHFAGDVRYWQPSGPITFPEGSVGGTAAFDESLSPKYIDQEDAAVGLAALLGAFSLFSFLSGALLIGLLLLLTRTYFVDAAKTLRTEMGRSALWGLLFFIVVPIAAVISMITVIGFPIGFFFLFGYIFTLVFAKPVTALVLSYAAAEHWKWKWSKLSVFAASLVILLGLMILTWIPVIGWIAKASIIVVTIGALQITKYRRVKKML